MYFPSLQNMKGLNGIPNISDPLIDQLDFWLASRRESIKNYLNPYSFSQYSNLSNELSLDLFYLCTTKEINILRVRFDVFINKTNTKLDSFYNINEIPESIEDYEHNIEVQITNDDILVYFELIKEPIHTPKLDLPIEMGKPQGVGIIDFEKTEKRVNITLSDILRKNQ